LNKISRRIFQISLNTFMPEKVQRPFIPFHQKLFLIIISTFLVFVCFFGVYQYLRERDYRIELLANQLQNNNNFLHRQIIRYGISDGNIKKEINLLNQEDLRVSIIDFQGNVIYDNKSQHLKNHANRPEFIEALSKGSGTSVRRTSATLDVPYFYSATKYPEYVIRTALPYNAKLNKQLQVNYSFISFTIILTIFLLLLLYQTTNRLGRAIAQLRDFAQNADKNRSIDSSQHFPNNELGEISQHIVGMFQRISKTRDALYIEREKLITHLQISHEGLAVFAPDKKEILANSLFIQYINLISNIPGQSADAIFQIPELCEINDYIQKTLKKSIIVGQMQRQSIQINKNGKIFQVICIIFQDRSFEVSINDITQKEEDYRLKRQLTQNIAHELKTPVSSIQGYMETIVDNPDLPMEKLHTFVERSYVQSKRLAELLKDISTLSRIDEAPDMVEMEPVNLHKLVSQIMGELELEIEKKQVKLLLSIDPNLIIRGSTSLLYSVFRNLMDNALAYAGENFEMAIICFRNDNEFCYFSFYDTGPGIPEEHLNRIFERFYRVDKGRSRKLGGTGLGLAIVKNAIMLHGGSISAKNRPQGGLEFVFSLAK
jgi:two-component system, OmpR family, sensor kinase